MALIFIATLFLIASIFLLKYIRKLQEDIYDKPIYDTSFIKGSTRAHNNLFETVSCIEHKRQLLKNKKSMF